MQNFAWRAAAACPCVSPASGAANPNCPICSSTGRVWAAEVSCVAGMQQMRNDKAIASFGTWAPGDALFTVGSNSPLYAAKQYDRIRAVNATNPFSQVLVPGANDKLLGTIISISRVFWLNPAGDTIIEGGIPTVNANGSLTFTSGAPPANTQFSVTGIRYDEFYVYMQLPANRNNDLGSTLPKKFQGRRFDLFGRGD